MAHVTISDGRVCIVKVSSLSSTREGLELLKESIIKLTTDSKAAKLGLDTYLFIDLSPFTVINSNLIGIFGSLVMDDNIKVLGLCGVQHSVLDILKRFGVISNQASTLKPTLGNTSKTDKVVPFRSVEDGLKILDT